jgi:hypothetical protein
MAISRRDLFALLLLATLAIGQGGYSVELNAEFYKVHSPFFDSCSYTKQLAIVIAKTRLQGIDAGIRESLSGNVALPFLEATLMARWLEPSRAMAVWLQAVWMIALALSCYCYFAYYRKLDRWLAFLLALPFISFARVYDWNGGLPDFRMDLSLYIFTSLAAVWYLATYESDSRLPWLLAGISAMLACLARATAPVYLLLMLGPLFLIRLATARETRRTLVMKSLWMALPITVAVGCFLAYNFSYLYFYYVTWGPDENRHLAWKESALHLYMAASHVGNVLIWSALAAVAIHIICRRNRIPSLDWKPIWLMLVTPMFMVIRGVGLNPFVTMPAVFGFLLFACVPYIGIQPVARFLWARLAIGVLLAGGAVACAAQAGQPQPFTGTSSTSMSGARALIDRVSQDARNRGFQSVSLILPELGDCHSCMMANVLLYEYGATAGEDQTLHISGGLRYHFPNELVFTASDELFWKDVPGKSESDKVHRIVAMMADDNPAYLILPDEKTLNWLEHDRSFYFINRHTRQLMSELIALNRWEPLGTPIQVDANETMNVFGPRSVHIASVTN